MPIDLDDDRQELIYRVERELLKNVFSSSVDLCEGRGNKEFAEAVGGMEKLEKEHDEAVASLRCWYSEGEGY